MITNIGIVAGEILTLLEEQEGPLHIKELIASLDTPKEIIHMGIGWLSREGYIRLTSKQDEIYISKLKKNSLQEI